MPLPSSVKRALASPLFKGACTTILFLLIEACSKATVGRPAYRPDAEDYEGPSYFRMIFGDSHVNKWTVVFTILSGLLLGAFFSDKFLKYRKWVWRLLMVALFILAVSIGKPFAYVAWFIVSFATTYILLKVKAKAGARVKPTTFGSAEWATIDDIARLKGDEEKLLGNDGLFLGVFAQGEVSMPLYYTGARHLLTIAPTRAGKGTTAIIPNLLTYEGSVLVIDPKGENAQITAPRRGAGDAGRKIAGMGQKVFVVDPWEITGLPVARFNPLEWLAIGDVDLSENAMMLADSIIVHRAESSEPFWDDEARALLTGLMMFVAIDPGEEGNRTLCRVRDIINLPDVMLTDIMNRMYESPDVVVSSTAARHTAKEAKLRSNVMTTLQSHTHFLDSPRMRESLSASDFRFEDMKTTPMSIYLVLPADRLDAFGRWLRLLVQQAITMNARNVECEPAKPILFLLDEMAALGHLKAVEQAYGLMAGYGMQLWGIVQDVSQLERVYSKGWETFVSNSGVLQYLGSRDEKTASYFSKLCGTCTIEKTSLSRSFSQTFGGTSSSNTSGNSFTEDHIARALALPDELMVLRKHQVLLLIENCNPIAGFRVNWFKDAKLKTLGVDLREKQRVIRSRVGPVGVDGRAAAAAQV